MSITLAHTTIASAASPQRRPAFPADRAMPPVLTGLSKALPTSASLIVLGRDDAGKTHASWFDADEAELATKAAGLMGMQALEIADDALRGAAAGLPHGRVFASGKAFVPFVKAATFEALALHLPPAARAQLDRPRVKSAPVDAKVAVGDASQPSGQAAKNDAKSVLDRSAAGKMATKANVKAASADGEGAQEQNTNNRVELHLPTDWSEIAAGSLVLASEGEGHGWYEAIVIEVHEEDLVTVGWRDWPDLPTLVRRRRHLGLLHPDHAAE
ncbi:MULTISPECIES: hypothetical protein [unclassified Aureimonas]|uniref:hypothetical protein n=1 Tax=unclassified Aureimonas TaxID=2615206 RepID=UPI0007007F02|nr:MULTISPECIES: hypothetical protein [unclassified Aureimonas]KQT64483.1 hypothetical protein ASG62_05915 [Aureimonas sp. Leaf427]KQT81670.1 hypothetical protein ASG54_03190 [Aureimonas sp. Leaf460]